MSEELERAVASHYASPDLKTRIEAALASLPDPRRIDHKDLAAVDEFHIGGRQATMHALGMLAPSRGQHVLDVGCGIGGAMRYLAAETGCRVTGIDLTPEYIEIARDLTRRTGLDGLIRYEAASALAMPFADASFDAGLTFHVAMNIADRAGLYGEIARVLKPGARFCVYDVMKQGAGAIIYPVPWAETAATSFLKTPEETAALLRSAGFELEAREDRRQFALDFFKQRLAATAGAAPQALSLNLVMGETARAKFQNMHANIEQGHCWPVVMIARRR